MELKGDVLVIGSDPKCDIVLNGAYPEHCRLEREGDDWFLVPLSGLTIANSGAVESRFRLSTGDLVGIKRVLLRMEGVSKKKRAPEKGRRRATSTSTPH